MMRWLVEGMQAEKVREGERCCTYLRHYYLSADQVESSPDEGNKGTCSYNLCTVELIRSVTIIEELFSGVVFSTVPKPKSPNLQ